MIIRCVGIFSEMVQASPTKHSLSRCNYDIHGSEALFKDNEWTIMFLSLGHCIYYATTLQVKICLCVSKSSSLFALIAKWAIPGLFLIYFWVFQSITKSDSKRTWKNIHLSCDAIAWAHIILLLLEPMPCNVSIA